MTSTDQNFEQRNNAEAIRIDYVPRAGLGKLAIVNFLLGLITFSIYRFWAKTNVRKHIWSCVHINGQPLEYTGKGKELFLGFLVVFGLFILPYVLLLVFLQIYLGPEHPSVAGLQGLFFLVVLVLWGAAVYRARRYQLSRTLWRGIRGTLEGSSATYSLLYFGSILASGMTLGWATPAMNTTLQKTIIGDMRFGSMPFYFRGRAGPLYPTYAICWFLSLAFIVAVAIGISATAQTFAGGFERILQDIADAETNPESSEAIGLIVALLVVGFVVYALVCPVIWSFYTAKELNTFASYMSFGDARFRLSATSWKLIKLVAGNFFIWLFSLGIAAPFVQQRVVRFLCDNLEIKGTVNVDRILQSRATVDERGEGLADAFDVGGI